MTTRSDRFIWEPTDIVFLDDGGKEKAYARELTPAERRVDFAALREVLDRDAVEIDLRLRQLIKKARDELFTLLRERAASSGFTAEFAQSLRLDTGWDFSQQVFNYLMTVWRKNRDLALKELPDAVRSKLQALRNYDTGFKPDLAGDYFQNRALFIKGLVDDELTRQVKLQIFEHLKGGRTFNETLDNLRALFEPWVGDPEKIVPSGLTGTAEDILQAYRLENIIRTETLTAMNQGRLAVADAAEDFVLGYEISAILDDRTTEICQLADGLRFRKDDARAVKLTPPLHYQCRSVLVFVTTIDVPVEWSDEADLDEVVRLIPKGFK